MSVRTCREEVELRETEGDKEIKGGWDETNWNAFYTCIKLSKNKFNRSHLKYFIQKISQPVWIQFPDRIQCKHFLTEAECPLCKVLGPRGVSSSELFSMLRGSFTLPIVYP